MFKTTLMLGVFFASAVMAQAPVVECRIAAMEEDGDLGLNEVVSYPIVAGANINGSFDPYEVDISIDGFELEISVYLDGEPLTGLEFPIANILALPVGASLFGVNTVNHETVDGFVAVRFACLRVY